MSGASSRRRGARARRRHGAPRHEPPAVRQPAGYDRCRRDESTVVSRANVIGLGLIGGSIAPRRSASAAGMSRRRRSAERGRRRRWPADASTPPGSIPTPTSPSSPFRCSPPSRPGRAGAEATTGIVTDVGSVKGALVRRGRRSPLRRRPPDGRQRARRARRRRRRRCSTARCGCSRPTAHTPTRRFAPSPRWSPLLGAEMVAMSPQRHDEMVAVVSHVPAPRRGER